MRNEFSTFDIVKALGIPRERLKDWMNNGFVKPTIPAEGQGTKAIFTRVDLYLTELFRDLLNKGFKRGIAADFIRKISDIFKLNEKGPGESAEWLAVIIFRYAQGDNQPVSANLIADPYKGSIDTAWGQSGIVNLQTGELDTSDSEDWWIFSENWDYSLTINFKTLRIRVDKALTVLD